MFVRWTRCASYLGLVQAHIRRLPASNTIFFVILVIMVVINIITTIIIISNTIAVIVITTVVHLIVRAQILRAPVCIKYPLLSHHRYHHYHLLAPSYLAALFFINFSNIAAINITVHNHPVWSVRQNKWQSCPPKRQLTEQGNPHIAAPHDPLQDDCEQLYW